MAIGAGRGRIVRQLLVESLTLAAIGGGCGVLLATIGANVLVDVMSRHDAPLVFDLSPNWRVIAFTSAVAIATAVLFGLAPALQSTAAGVAPALKDDNRTAAARSRLLPSLITVQIALSLVLLVGAGLFVRTLRNLQILDPGFKSEGVLLAEFDGRRDAIPAVAVEAVRALPGVISASIATHTPLNGSGWSDPAVPAGQPLPDKDTAMFVGAGPGFFETLGLPIVSGRTFSATDTREATAVAIVNQRYAERYFPHENPVGRHLNAEVNGERKDLEIVGVAADTKTGGLRKPAPLTVYVAYAQLRGNRPSTIAVRASGSLTSLQAAVQRAIQPLVPDRPFDMQPLSTQVASTIVQERMMATLGSGFGALALVLASVGVYGLLAYAVARRTREIGLRVALGAQRSGVIALVVTSAWRPLLIGVALGLPAAWAASRWIESLLFGLRATDPMTIGGAVLVLVAVAHLAAWLPARRAARVDPLIALRSE
jgi:predicted permease